MEMTIMKNRGFGKAILTAFAVVALAAALLAATLAPQPAEAHGTGIPYHQSGGASCWYGSNGYLNVQSKVPAQMRSWYGGMENVRWSPDLYRWNGTSWQLYDQSKPWMQAAANGNGLVRQQDGTYWTNLQTGFPYLQGNGPVFSNLPRGSYAVKEYYYWLSSGHKHTQWSTFNNTSSTSCTG